ncbi:NADH dehydrogenase (complex I) alpha subcomplex subunit 6 [Penicillium verhagenii]|uniref:NADH dehydrogenase (complex I) alpha subcomplex subunit 6 n=1 Tax=Penicillium verhagenii TaxID=1562060 RepID=UPI002545779D|nr:NADH dehydrogenase (complex I) alpha subcomplex subunit 6 [Penicillium verhagenii]KAJ5921488.1 NADH dehydrogenase (complex I) alpha subcomplex subunit 6 [Penicillium verhagenii]
MTINPTYLAQRTRSSLNLNDAKFRVLKSYREWLRAVSLPQIPRPTSRPIVAGDMSPEIQTMYSLNMPVSVIRTKIRQEFEKHRYVSQLSVIDVLLYQSHAEFQETLNYWKQLSHVMKYFRAEEDPGARLPRNFVSGFLEGRN